MGRALSVSVERQGQAQGQAERDAHHQAWRWAGWEEVARRAGLEVMALELVRGGNMVMPERPGFKRWLGWQFL